MFIKMLENRVVRFVLYGLSGALLTELAFYGCLYVRSAIMKRSEMQKEISAAKMKEIKRVANAIASEVLKEIAKAKASQYENENSAHSAHPANSANSGNSGNSANSDFAKDDDEVAEVIWTNELTLSCIHDRHCPEQYSDTHYLTKSPTTCRNPYCTSYSVGRLIELFDQTHHSIDLAMYTFTSKRLIRAFVRAYERGVSIRVISDNEMVYSSNSQIADLLKTGIPVRCPVSEKLMHHKFCILDGAIRTKSAIAFAEECAALPNANKKVKSLLICGSLNWTNQGFSSNWENALITSNKTIIRQYETEFERLWKANNDRTTVRK